MANILTLARTLPLYSGLSLFPLSHGFSMWPGRGSGHTPGSLFRIGRAAYLFVYAARPISQNGEQLSISAPPEIKRPNPLVWMPLAGGRRPRTWQANGSALICLRRISVGA